MAAQFSGKTQHMHDPSIGECVGRATTYQQEDVAFCSFHSLANLPQPFIKNLELHISLVITGE